MSEINLIIRDSQQSIQGRVHGSDGDRAIAALAAEPETIAELDVAMRRFTGETDRSHFSHFRPGDSAEPWDAGVVVIDLAARLIAGKSSYSSISSAGSVLDLSCKEAIRFQLSDDWEIVLEFDSWRSMAKRRREEHSREPRIDVRNVLYGKPLVEFIAANQITEIPFDCDDEIAQVHADWLVTPRQDLGGRAPRAVMLAGREAIESDIAFREHQWSASGACPEGLDRSTASYRYAAFGTHEIVVYYDLVRYLLKECNGLAADEPELSADATIARLEELRDKWLESRNRDYELRTGAAVIDHERRRIPEFISGAEAAIDCDCPICQMMAEDPQPYFWGLDGANMDDQFAFSFHLTRADWEAEQQRWEDHRLPFAAEQAGGQAGDSMETEIGDDGDDDDGDDDSVWQRCFVSDELSRDMPLSEYLPVAEFGFAAMIGEVNQDVRELADDAMTGADQVKALNRLFGNLREALRTDPELIDPTLDRLERELAVVRHDYPKIAGKCDDLIRRLEEFPENLAASAARM
ncbi:hypothetical protein OAS39_04975 [Pirellulales bacterium]|nr:hypothetical protein [Pirellulales bacterium]